VTLNEKAGIVSVNVMSSAALNGATRQMTVDGVPYRSFIVNPGSVSGHWKLTEVWDDNEEAWVMDWRWVADPDLTKATLTTYASGAVLDKDGNHTVVASIKDANGTVVSDTWTFTVKVAPQFGAPSPANGAIVDTTTVDISVPVSDNSAVTGWNVTVNGAAASATLSGGALHITPATPLVNSKPYTVAATINDAVGATTSLSWTFNVQTLGQMLDQSGDCVGCHPGYENDLDMNANCRQCHSGFSAPHTGNPAVFHTSASLSDDCLVCHVSDLLPEHARHNDSHGVKISCVTCHASQDSKVAAAIAAGNSACSACHTGAGHVADFAKASSHTLGSTPASHNQDVQSSAFVQTFYSDFLANPTQSNVALTNLAGGEVRLGTDPDPAYGNNPPAQTGLLFAAQGGTANFDQYKPADNAWDTTNSAAFTPASMPGAGTASGASAFTMGGKIYVVTGSTAYIYTPSADPTADSWATNSNFGGSISGLGADSAVSAARIFISRGNSGSNSSRVYFKPVAGSSTSSYFTVYSGAAVQLSNGSAMAYSSQANRLFVINKNGGTSAAGTLLYVGSPDTIAANANATMTTGPQVTQSGTTSVYNRMTPANIGGTDYLFILGPNSTGTTTLQVVSNLSGVPTVTDTGMSNPFGAASPLADGCDLEYNAADGYLYAIRGGGTTGFARIAVPATPATPASWAAWQSLASMRAWPAGSALAFANADPINVIPPRLYASGTFGGVEVNPAAGDTKWGQVAWDATTPANSSLTVAVEGFDGASWQPLTSSAASPIDVSAYSTGAWPKLRLTATLGTTAPTNMTATPVLNSWSVTSASTITVQDAAQLSCIACHQARTASASTDFCVSCHTGTLADPYTSSNPAVVFRTVLAPFFPGWSKTVAGIDYAGSAHGNSGTADVTALSQNLGTEWAADTLSNVQLTNYVNGESKLATDTSGGSNPGAQTGLLFATNGGTTNFDQYKPVDSAWDATNSALFTPASVPANTGTGASAFTMGGKIYVESGSTAYQYTPAADPTPDSWVASSNAGIGTSVGAGSDSALSAARIYVLRGGSSSGGRIYYKPRAGSGSAAYMQAYAGASLSLQNGAAMAYSSQANRLFVINKNGSTTASGTLLYITNPDAVTVANANATMTVGPQVTPSGTTSVYNRMTCVNVGGTDYLFILGQNAAGATTLQVVSNLAGTPTVTDTAMSDPFGASAPLAEGCDLEYNAADGYLYAIRGGYTTGFARIAVPASPNVAANWSGWQTLASMRSFGNGSTLAFANADPLYTVTFKYFAAGSVMSPAITAPYGATSWGSVTASVTVPANSAFSVMVEGFDGTAWSTLLPSASLPVDLSAYSVSAYPQIRITALLSSNAIADVNATPLLDSWTVKALGPGSALRPGCQTCHTNHGSNNDNLVAYTPLNGATATDDSTAEAGAGLCYECHGVGSGAGMDVQGPDSQTYGHPIAQSATKHSDRETAADERTTRHSDCSDCHNAHAAKSGGHVVGQSTAAPSLNGVTGLKVAGNWPANFSALSAADFKPTTLTGKTDDTEANLCFKCHTSAAGDLPTVTTPSGTYQSTDVAREFNPNNFSLHNVTGANIGMKTVFNFTNTASVVVTATWGLPTTTWLTAGWTTSSKMTCTDCHTGGTVAQASGPHGSTAKWMLDPQYQGTTDWTAATMSNIATSKVICNKCHTGYSQMNDAHGEHGHSTTCGSCHIAIPHGWKRPRLLGYATDPAPYATTAGQMYGYAATRAGGASPGVTSWSESDCYAGCTGTHSKSNAPGPYIP
jgi:hypothetical protein